MLLFAFGLRFLYCKSWIANWFDSCFSIRRSDKATDLPCEPELKSTIEMNFDIQPQQHGRARSRSATSSEINFHDYPEALMRRGRSFIDPTSRLRPPSELYPSTVHLVPNTDQRQPNSNLNGPKPEKDRDQGETASQRMSSSIWVRKEPELPLSERTGKAARERPSAEKSAGSPDSRAPPGKVSDGQGSSCAEVHTVPKGRSSEEATPDTKESPRAVVPQDKDPNENITKGNEMQRLDHAVTVGNGDEDCRTTTLWSHWSPLKQNCWHTQGCQ